MITKISSKKKRGKSARAKAKRLTKKKRMTKAKTKK
jgi:hypothetical protein